VDLNESAANFAGLQGAVDFFEQRLKECPENNKQCMTDNSGYLTHARDDLSRAFDLSRVLTPLEEELNKLYKGDLGRKKTLILREEIFEKHLRSFRLSHPEFKGMQRVNNAEILLLRLYFGQIDSASQIYNNHNESWQSYIRQIAAD